MTRRPSLTASSLSLHWLPLLWLPLVEGCATPAAEAPAPVLGQVAQYPGCDIAVAYMDLASGRQWSIGGAEEFHAASTMKVAVMIELFAKDAEGQLDLDGDLIVKNEFFSIVDGSPYSLTKEDDGEQDLYARIDSPLSIRELTRRMIVSSSNLATNMLVEVARADDIQHTIEELGTKHMRVLRGVEDIVAYRAGLSNTTTANDLRTLMAAIGDGRAVSEDACTQMITILEAQEYNDLIPAALPAETRVAHKTGMITGIRHDAALVWPAGSGPYVLIVLTRGFDDPEEAARVIREVAGEVHQAHASAP